MEFPDFQEVMLPLIKFASDGKPHRIKEGIEHIVKLYGLSNEERSIMLPSGAEPIIDNRVRWARFHLKKAGVFVDPMRGQFQITARGMQLIETNPSHINMKVLEQYPEYRSIKKPGNIADEITIDTRQKSEGALVTPEESIDYGYRQLDAIPRTLGEEDGFF